MEKPLHGKIPILPLKIARVAAQIPPIVKANLPTGVKYSLFELNTLPMPLKTCHNISPPPNYYWAVIKRTRHCKKIIR